MTQRKASAFLLPKRTGLRTALKHPILCGCCSVVGLALQSQDLGCLDLDMGETASRFSFNNKSPSHPVDSNQRDPHLFSHLTDYFVYGATCSLRLRIASMYFQLSMISFASFALLKYFQLFGCPIVHEVVSQFVPTRHFQEKKKKRFVIMMMMLYADFKKT